MIQYLLRKIINTMGSVYVFLDKFRNHNTSPILGFKIDEDLQEMSRHELCNYIESKFGLEKNSFWELESTQKIRLSAQLSRYMEEIQ